MSVSTASHRVEFQDRAKQALQDVSLQRALAKARGGFVDHRQEAIDALPEFDALVPHHCLILVYCCLMIALYGLLYQCLVLHRARLPSVIVTPFEQASR